LCLKNIKRVVSKKKIKTKQIKIQQKLIKFNILIFKIKHGVINIKNIIVINCIFNIEINNRK